MPIQVLLSPAALAWIGGAFENKTRVSPMSNLDPSGFSIEARDDLVARGVLDPGGNLNPACYAALKELAAATSYCRIRYSGGPALIEKTVYFSPTVTVSIDNTPDGLLIECPARSEQALESLSQFVGTSRLVNSELSVELAYDEALLLATMIDMRRRDVLRAYAEGAPGFVPQAHSLDQIARAIESASDDPRWLASIVKSMKPSTGTAAESGSDAAGLETGQRLKQILDNLVRAGLVVQGPGGFDLAGEPSVFASSFLIVEGILHVQTGAQGAGGEIQAAECVFVQAGMRDIVSTDGGGGTVSMETLSGALLQEYMRRFLSSPPVFSRRTVVVQPPHPVPSS